MFNKKSYLLFCLLSLLSVTTIISKENTEQLLDNDYDVITIPSPAAVQVEPGGRFYSRIQGNMEYLFFQHEVFGKEMIDAFKSRHYSPGKLLERMWDGEYAGKWLDAATRTAVNTDNDSLISIVDSFADSLKNHQQPDGYMGIKPPTDRELTEWERLWDLWNQWNSMIGLLSHYEYRGDQSSLDAAESIADWILKKYAPVTSGDNEFLFAMNNVVVIGQLVRLYQHSGDEKLIRFVGQAIEHFRPIKEMVKTGEPYLFHPYMLGAALEGVVKYAAIVGDDEMFSRIEEVWQQLANAHMFPTGSLGEREDLDDEPIQDVPDGQLQETCATTEWIFLTMDLYELTGEEKYIEALERTIYNALIGAQSDDGMKWCYWTPLRYSKNFLHGPTRCCFWSGPRGIARIPQIIYSFDENDIYVNIYESSEGVLNTAGGKVKIIQSSDFPAEGKSSLTVSAPAGWTGRLNLRIPAWAKNFIAKSNNQTSSDSGAGNNYVTVLLTGKNEYRVDIEFDIKFFLDKLGENYVMRRGPEVLALDTRDNIDTWLGAKDDLITIPDGIQLFDLEPGKRYQWAGPLNVDRRRYRVKVEDARTAELRSVILTPYADAGNNGAAFRTAFPAEAESIYPGNWFE